MMNKNSLCQLNQSGQSVWYDYIERRMLHDGTLERLIREDDLRGMTSNPAIFEKAITSTNDYQLSLQQFKSKQLTNGDARQAFFELAVEDVQQACDLFLSVYNMHHQQDGFVSLEVSPDLAHDTEGTVQEAKRLWQRVNRPNLMIKVPATVAGLSAIQQLIAAGINVNVTLLFSLERYQAVIEAYCAGLKQRLAEHLPVDHIASVASFFISRIDTAIEPLLEAQGLTQYMGKVAIYNAQLAYKEFHQTFMTSAFDDLAQAGAKPQRLLWASTGTKNAQYPPVYYIESLVAPHTINTIPPQTYEAFRQQGNVKSNGLSLQIDAAEACMQDLQRVNIDFAALTTQLEIQGLALFDQAFAKLLTSIDKEIC